MLLRLPSAVFYYPGSWKVVPYYQAGACSKVVVATVNLSILGSGLEGLSHPTSYFQTGVCVLQPSQNDSHLLPSLKSPENDTDEEPS